MPLSGEIIDPDDLQGQFDALDTRVTNLESANPKCRVSRASSLSVANITGTDVPFTDESWDIGPIHSGSDDELICPLDGIYDLKGFASWEANGTGYRLVRIKANGAELVSDSRTAVAGDETAQPISIEVFLSAGDIVQLLVYQDSGGSLNLLGVSLTMRYVGTTS